MHIGRKCSDTRLTEEADLLYQIVRSLFLGETFQYCGESFRLPPSLFSPYDLLRRSVKADSEYERLLRSLDSRFKDKARSEMYRRDGGWIARLLQQRRIRRLQVDRETVLVPVLSGDTVGIDTSSFENKITIVAFCFIADAEAGYAYLEKHLEIPKTHNHSEFKWGKLNADYKEKIMEKFEYFMRISFNALVLVETDALISPTMKIENIFRNLVEGCFSGYRRDPRQASFRPALCRKLFNLANNVPIHCDADFRGLRCDHAVRLFVQTLAKKNDFYEPYTPLYAASRSYESKPIQLADILVGAFRTKIQENKPLSPMARLPFDSRKMAKVKRYAKAYYWPC